MSKSDQKFIDTNESTGWYELRDWLNRNGFEGGKDNRAGLRGIIDAMRTKKGDNISWEELDYHLAKSPESFRNLTKA
ncbi:hypothetical protein SAMN05421848_3329 [Kushneria avicenniae]|uniref:Uncharacterized protein n=1 Tax=Kushneria avicenniae TaxID=402385 RepID=A0A1I1N4Q4_9GAMM|nr:hypothetical protein SAMN05421848_3329 [Kushneria avicenniae]